MVIHPNNRLGLERLVGYYSRPALSLRRLIYSAATKTVIYRAEHLEGKPGLMTMDALEFLRRWGLLMPPPHKNLVHYMIPPPRSTQRLLSHGGSFPMTLSQGRWEKLEAGCPVSRHSSE